MNFGLGHGYSDFAGSGVVHSIGGITALVLAVLVGPRIGKFDREGRPHAIPGHDIVLVLTGCFILCFGWFGFNPGSTLGASGNGNLRIGSVAVNTMLAGMAGGFSAMFYMWLRYGKPDASMSGNGLLAGLVAIDRRPVLRREVVERQQHLAVLGQALDRLGILGGERRGEQV